MRNLKPGPWVMMGLDWFDWFAGTVGMPYCSGSYHRVVRNHQIILGKAVTSTLVISVTQRWINSEF